MAGLFWIVAVEEEEVDVWGRLAWLVGRESRAEVGCLAMLAGFVVDRGFVATGDLAGVEGLAVELASLLMAGRLTYLRFKVVDFCKIR